MVVKENTDINSNEFKKVKQFIGRRCNNFEYSIASVDNNYDSTVFTLVRQDYPNVKVTFIHLDSNPIVSADIKPLTNKLSSYKSRDLEDLIYTLNKVSRFISVLENYY